MSETFDEREARWREELQESRARTLLRLRADDVQLARWLWRRWRAGGLDMDDIERRMGDSGTRSASS